MGLYSEEPFRSIVSPPEWSPDGRHIAFMAVADGVRKLYTIGRDGTDLHEMDEADGTHFRSIRGGDYFSPSPDGLSIAHFVYLGSNVVLYTAAPDGSGAAALVRIGENGELAAVGPEQRPSAEVSSCSAGIVVPDPESNAALVRDCRVLIEMIDRLVVAGLNWGADTPIAEWEGVTLDDPRQGNSSTSVPQSSLRIRGLSLPGRGLIGSIPLKMTKLTELGSLDLSDNELRGQLDNSLWGSLVNLQVLDLSSNDLSGPVPAELGGLRNLQELNLGRNWNLSGPIPPELGNLPNLEYLYLGRTAVSGCIPGGLCGKVIGYEEPEGCEE